VTPDGLFLWVVFNIFVLGMLALDLGVFHRKAHAVSLREASPSRQLRSMSHGGRNA